MVSIDYKELFKDWEPVLRKSVLETPYMNMLIRKIHYEYKYKVTYPEKKDIFRAFKLTSFDETRVVILGQDPYPSKRATGIAFGNDEQMGNMSPSLEKIYDCIENTVKDGLNLNFDPTLVNWGQQGVLLLNSALSVRKGEPGSHTLYWKKFIQGTLEEISNRKTGVCFLLLGAQAKSFRPFINESNNYVFSYVHPAFSARQGTDWNCPYFRKINEVIEHQNGKEFCIDW